MRFDDLSSILSHATSGAHSATYRALYGMTPDEPPRRIRSIGEWRALPPLTKDALLSSPMRDRLYAPLSEIDHIRASSGTSGKGVLFSPRTHVRGMEYRLGFHDFKRPFIAFTVPLMPHWHESFQKEHGLDPRVIAYDPKHPKAIARLARATGADGMSVFVFHITAIGEEMKRLGVEQQMKFIEITGETCSRSQFEYLRRTFPSATIVQSYNSSEVEDAHIGMPCKPMDGTEPRAVYHPKKTHFLELIDPETGEPIEPRAGAEGDLLITAYPGQPCAFPLIRFRIGDTVRVVDDACPHGAWSFTVLGRTDLDFKKLPGGMLRAEAVARALARFPGRVSDRFELHCHDRLTPAGAKMEPVLHVECGAEEDLERLALDVAAEILVAPSFSYAQGVAEGRYRPLVCRRIEQPLTGKTRRITVHTAD